MANTARFESASEIIKTVAVEFGLSFNSAPYSSPDPAYKQLITLLTVCGRILALIPSWNMAVREGTITVVAGVTEYDLPEDFLSMVNSTVWNRGSDQAVYGSATPQMWTLWARENPALSYQCIFRLARRKFVIPADTVPVGTVLSYEYRSRAWVLSGTQVDVYKDKADDPGDIVLFEPVLITRMLLFKFTKAKGFDSTGAFNEFVEVLNAVMGVDVPAEVLSLVHSAWGPRFLDYSNIPDTGFGS